MMKSDSYVEACVFILPVVCQRFEEPEVTCLAYIPRWRYDHDSQTCENFIYGGCNGNANNFETIEACEKKCTAEEEKPEEPEREDTRVSSWRGSFSQHRVLVSLPSIDRYDDHSQCVM